MRSIPCRSGAILFALLTAFVCTGAIRAQSNASIQGEVTDQNGAVVPGAEVTFRSEAIGIDRKTTTDSGGRYLIAALPVGDYHLEVQASGFTRQVFEGIRIEVGRAFTRNVQLQVGNVSQTVNVAPGAGNDRARNHFRRSGDGPTFR
jgi:hypothetical protein